MSTSLKSIQISVRNSVLVLCMAGLCFSACKPLNKIDDLTDTLPSPSPTVAANSKSTPPKPPTVRATPIPTPLPTPLPGTSSMYWTPDGPGIIASESKNPVGIKLTITRASQAEVKIYRRTFNDTSFTLIATLKTTDPNIYIDRVDAGVKYEYYATNTHNHPDSQFAYKPTAYVLGSTELPEQRGTLALVIEEGLESKISPELQIFEDDLVGEGWEVVQMSATRSTDIWKTAADSVPAIVLKEKLRALQQQTGGKLKGLILLGHVPIPRSGLSGIDGHDDNQGAWPADLYYGDFTGKWTDAQPVASATFLDLIQNKIANLSHRNLPGDGKFSEDYVPGRLTVQIGRIDFYGLSIAKTADAEATQIRRYIRKNHAYRHQNFSPERGALRMVTKGFPLGFHEAQNDARTLFPASQNQNITAVAWDPARTDLSAIRDTLKSTSYTWVVGRAFGARNRAMGLIHANDFASTNTPLRAVFWSLFGSYFGEFTLLPDNLLRSVLISTSDDPVKAGQWGLASFYTQNWLLHRMALGDTLGEANILTANDAAMLKNPQGSTGAVAIRTSNSILGDPTLRLHTLPSVTSAKVVFNKDSAEICWLMPENLETEIDGFLVFRSNSAKGPYSRITASPVDKKLTCFKDSGASSSKGHYFYRVKTTQWVATPFGNYRNQGQGILAVP